MANLLIVDDTVESCDLLARLFARCGHTPACLYGGAGVLAALRDHRFHLVLLDVMMPGLDGFAVLAAIRNDPDPRVARTPVAMYTAVSCAHQQERALAMGANEWVVKGTPFQLLCQRLDPFLGSDAPRAPSQPHHRQ